MFTHHGLLELRRFRVQIEATRSRVVQVEEENRRLNQQAHLLQEESQPIVERQIRENLGWVKHDELVYVEKLKPTKR